MMSTLKASRTARFFWRAGRNLVATFPAGRRLLFRPERLALAFGPDDPRYAVSVFESHREKLARASFTGARAILEIGPGPNPGPGLLWWANEVGRGDRTPPRVVLWDVFANMAPGKESWSRSATELLQWAGRAGALLDDPLLRVLKDVAHGAISPTIEYVICSHRELEARYRTTPFDLVYSQAALEHAWAIEGTWRSLVNVTSPGGWHSHRIDLADHGRRTTNYLEMAQWSDLAYWVTTRNIPGAINRWRAADHLSLIRSLGLEVLSEARDFRPTLPVPRDTLAKRFRSMPDEELRTVGLDVVARLSSTS